MKKKGKKSKHNDDSFNDNSDGDNVDSARKPSRASKTRLRRRREGSYIRSDSDSSDHDKKQKKRRKRRKRSRTTTGTTEESSDWDEGSHYRKESRVTTADEKEKPREVTEKHLVERIQHMVPYLNPNSPLWTKWTLAPIYHFIRKPNAMMVIAFSLNNREDKTSPIPIVIKRLLKFYAVASNKTISENEQVLVTFNQHIPGYHGEFFYFIKSSSVKITGENFEDTITFGNTVDGPVHSLNSHLVHLWSYILLEEVSLPKEIMDEVLTDLNSLACSSQSTAHLLDAQEVLLYVPQEAIFMEKSDNQLSKDKEFCTRLEETVIYWLTKLKQVLILKELDDMEGWPGPLEEIIFWQSRTNNLFGILKQIKSSQIMKLFHILATSRSPYLTQFRSILKELGDAYKESASNYHYLQALSQPCGVFSTIKLSEVKTHIQKFLWVVLIIKRNAPFYNTPKKLNGLLRKFSNVMILMCQKRINLGSLLQGRLIKRSEKAIKNCLSCLSWWKEIYASTKQMCLHKDEWIFDYDQIFVHVDAMISRLNDLQEICAAQRLYGRKLDDTGDTSPLPLYSGVKGPYISNLMEHIQLTINSKMEDLAKISHLIMDVKNTEWIDHMNNFQAEVLSAEMSIQNVLEEVFDQMSDLHQRLQLLQQFYVFYSRDIIIRQIDKLTIQLYEYFEDEVLKLRKLFEQKVIPLPNTYTHMAGRGSWATYMKKRIESHLELFKNADIWLPKSLFGDSVKSDAKSLSEAMAAFSQQTYEEWSTTKEILDGKDFREKLDIPLLVRGSREKKDIVEVNFDRNLFRILAEAEIWARVGRPVPLVLLMSVYTQREKLHNMRENISLVAKSYNDIISRLSLDERLLFCERLLPLEKKLYPCVTTYTWSSALMVDPAFAEGFQQMAKELKENIKAYRATNSDVARIIHQISRRLVVKISPNKIYEPEEFRSSQCELITRQLKRTVRDYQSIAKILRELFKVFHEDGPEVKVQWGKYVKLVDDCVEEALSLSLRNSLQILESFVVSSNKPLFQLEMKLEENVISFHPNLEEFAEMIFGVKRNIALALEHLSKLSQYTEHPSDSSDPVKTERSFTKALLNDPESLEIQKRIKFSIEKCFSELNLYSERWTPYRDIWEVERGTFMEKYGEGFPSISAYEKDMAKYLEVAEVVHGSEDFINIRFVRLDCTHMKKGISDVSMEWFQMIAGTVYKKAKGTLEGLYSYMESNRRKFSEEPKTLDFQLDLFRLLDNVKSESRQKASLFPVINEQFGILNKLNFEIDSEVNDQFLTFEKEWKSYQKFLKETDKKLDKSYDKLKVAFLECAENLKGKVEELLKSFEKTGPFSKEHLIRGEDSAKEEYWEWALTSLENFLNDVTALKEEDSKLISSLKFFNIARDANPILMNLESEVNSLALVWGKVRQCESIWMSWKSIQIGKLNLGEIHKTAAEFLTEFQKLEKDFEAKSWQIISETGEFIQSVQACLRTVNFLKNESMRGRHWDRIKSLVGDPNLFPQDASRPEEFTFGTLVASGLHRYIDQLSLISLCSGKETAIENTLKNIQEFWAEETFILGQRKGLVPFHIRCRSHLQDELIDHIVSISAMKGSPFIWPFQERVDYWAELLPLVSRVLEDVLVTQKEWLFLEKVFSNEDIRKEMPRQTKQFKTVTHLWAIIVLVMTKEKHVIKVVEKAENLPVLLEDIQIQMERLQKDLKLLLQNKRQEFPRLYFIPDHELLECLANSRDPQQILPILQNLFGNLSQLKLSCEKQTKIVEIQGIVSGTGEELEFCQGVYTADSLASWLSDLECSIKSSVKWDMDQCLESLQQSGKHQEEGFPGTEWLCQSYLTAVHIQWTMDAMKAIYLNGSNVEEALAEGQTEKNITLKKISKKLRRSITKISEILEGGRSPSSKKDGLMVTPLQRLKVEELLLKYMHLCDITDRLQSRNCSDLNSFEWLQHIRFNVEDGWSSSKNDVEYGTVVMKQGFSCIEYGYEFTEWGQRFVITPLVERCFLALTTAISFHYGGLIHGNSGLGKTEMINQLGKKLGRHVMNINLSSTTESNYLSSVVLGLVPTGSWAILNNIDQLQPHLLSLVASKLALITKVKSENLENLMLDGVEVKMNMSCGIFAVIGRRSNDDGEIDHMSSLRAVTRPVAMMKPDVVNILDVKLYIAGFENSSGLGRKLEELFSTAKDIICYQNRCRFSLTSMLAVVTQARGYKETYKKRLNDSEAIVKALHNVIMSALTQAEKVAFGSLIKDQFPSDKPIKLENQRLEEAIRISIKELGFQSSERLVKQCLRLHEIMQVYEVTILTGSTGSGKSVLRKVLKLALQFYQYQRVNEFVINPAIHEPRELLGYSNPQSGKWKDGIFANILASQSNCVLDHVGEDGPEVVTNSVKKETTLWIVLDGPVQGNVEWIIQQLLKLSKHKTLMVKSKISIIVETDELVDASPSLISQAGVVLVDEDPKTWKLQLRSWLNGLVRFKAELSKNVPPLMEKCLAFSAENCPSHLGSSLPPACTIICMFANLMESFFVDLEAIEKDLEGDQDKISLLLRQVTGFCIVWSVFGTLDEDSKLKASAFLKDFDNSVFPTKGTVFDYFFDISSEKWVHWKHLMSDQWRKLHSHSLPSSSDKDFGRTIVNTETTVRSEYFLRRYGKRCPVLVIGYDNSGKTSVVSSMLRSNSQQEASSFLHIQMTPKMKGSYIQSLIESRLERVSSIIMSPVRGNMLTIFIDDLHVYSLSAQPSLFQSQTSAKLTNPSSSSSYCEFLRTLVEYQMWYDRETGMATAISNVSIVAGSTLSRAKNSGLIPTRLLSKFSLVYIPPPDEFQIRKIFTSKLDNKLKDFAPSVKLLADDITVATLETFKKISTQLPPVPSKPLHNFSVHDISRVYEGLLRSDKGVQDTKHGFLRLWFHEFSRVFHDRLMNASSRQKCRDILTEQLFIHFELHVSSVFPQTGGAPTLFGNFMGGSRTKVYGEIKDEASVRSLLMKASKKLENDGERNGSKFKEGNVILFKSAVVQTTRIARVMSMPKGHLIIIGEGGQGRQTLSKLASSLLQFAIFDLSTTFETSSFIILKKLLKDAYQACTLKNLGCCVLLTDEHVSEDTLELISIVTSTVEIAGLYTKKELHEMMGQLEKDQEKQTSNSRMKLQGTADFLAFMKERVEQNLHVVLCLNPKNNRFMRTLIQAPSLLKQMSVSWFDIWRKESFLEVARSLLPSSLATDTNIDDPISSGAIFYCFHSIAEQLGKRAGDLRITRFSSITPMYFHHFVELYLLTTNELKSKAEEELEILQNAIEEITGVQEKIENLTGQVLNAVKKAQASRDDCHNFQEIVEKQSTDTKEQNSLVNGKSEQLNAEEKEFEELAEVIRTAWTSSLQGFEESTSDLQDLSEEDITHIRSYYSAPPLVLRVLDAVMIMLDREPTWPEAKIQLGHPEFIRKIQDFDKALVTMEKLNKLRVYLQNPEFTPDAVAKYSNGARILCCWIHAVDNYCRTYLTRILPKRERLEEAEQSIAEARYSLELDMQKLELLKENLAELQSNYEAKLQLKESYEEDSNHWNEILQRAQSVLELLKEDQLQWKEEVGHLEKTLENVRIDSLFSSACLSYLGPFNAGFRIILKKKWMEELKRRKMTLLGISTKWFRNRKMNKNVERKTLHLSFEEFTKKDDDLTGIMLEKTNRKLLIVDPFDMTEDCPNFSVIPIQIGGHATLSELRWKLESEKGNETENTLAINPTLVTKDPNPEVGTEVASHFYIVNLTLSAKELKEYLASKLAELVIPEEESKRQLLRQRLVMEEQTIFNLKERVPRLVLSFKEAMLENGDFPNALTKLKRDLSKAESKREKMLTEMQILELKREQLLPLAERMQNIYAALQDLSQVFQEYEVSPKFFVGLIGKILDRFQRGPSPSEGVGASQMKPLVDVMEFLEGNACKILLRQLSQSMTHLDRHLFALLLCITYLRNDDNSKAYCPSLDELSFLSKVQNPFEYSDYFGIGNREAINTEPNKDEELQFLSNDQFEKLKELERLANYEDLIKSIKDDVAAWEVWMKYFEPENKFPESSKLHAFQKLLLLSILRPDRLAPMIKILADEVLGENHYNFLESNYPIDLKQVYSDIAYDSPVTPIVFMLDDKSLHQIDPLASIQALSRTLKPPQKLYSLSISPGNVDLALKLLEQGVKQGYWVYFSNSHCAPKWMSRLEEWFVQLKSEGVHNDFRLWMSIIRSADRLPMEVLRNSMKIAVESTNNFQTSMSRLLMKMSGAMRLSSVADEKAANTLNRLLYGFSFLHCNLIGRNKFLSGVLPRNELAFQDIDFEISSAILKMFVSTYSLEEMPWWALKLVLDHQYSNHFSSVCAQQYHRLVQVLMQRVICKEIVSEADYRLSSSNGHQNILLRMPPSCGGDLSAYHKFISTVPSNYAGNNGDDNPEIYGLDISVGILMNSCQARSMLYSLGQILLRMVNKFVVRLESMNPLQDDQEVGQHESIQKDLEQGLEWLDNNDMIQHRIMELLETLPKPIEILPKMLIWKSLLLDEKYNGEDCDGENLDDQYSQALQYVMFMELKHSIDLLSRERWRLENLLGVVKGILPMSVKTTMTFEDYKLCGTGNFIFGEVKSSQSFPINFKRGLDQLTKSFSPGRVWLYGLLHPNAYLASALHKIAKDRGTPMSTLRWDMKFSEKTTTEFHFSQVEPGIDNTDAADGDDKHTQRFILENLHLVGAGWDSKENHFKECNPMETTVNIPFIRIVPQENEVGGMPEKGVYFVPCYHLQPSSTTSPTSSLNILSVGLNSSKEDLEHWILAEAFLVTNGFTV